MRSPSSGLYEAVGERGERMGLEGQFRSSRVLFGLVRLPLWWAADPGAIPPVPASEYESIMLV